MEDFGLNEEGVASSRAEDSNMSSSYTMLSKHLKQARAYLRRSQAGMNDLLRLGKRSWQRYESGANTPGSQVITALVEQGFNANWLLTGQGSMLLGEIDSPVETAEGLLAVDDKKLNKNSRDKQNTLSKNIAFHRDWLKENNLDINLLSLFTIKGDAMEPTFKEGDIVVTKVFYHKIGDDSKSEIVSGLGSDEKPPEDGLYVIRLNDHLVIRRIQLDTQGELNIVSDNPAYPAINLNKEKAKKLGVAAKVVWAGRSF